MSATRHLRLGAGLAIAVLLPLVILLAVVLLAVALLRTRIRSLKPLQCLLGALLQVCVLCSSGLLLPWLPLLDGEGTPEVDSFRRGGARAAARGSRPRPCTSRR